MQNKSFLYYGDAIGLSTVTFPFPCESCYVCAATRFHHNIVEFHNVWTLNSDILFILFFFFFVKHNFKPFSLLYFLMFYCFMNMFNLETLLDYLYCVKKPLPLKLYSGLLFYFTIKYLFHICSVQTYILTTFYSHIKCLFYPLQLYFTI